MNVPQQPCARRKSRWESSRNGSLHITGPRSPCRATGGELRDQVSTATHRRQGSRRRSRFDCWTRPKGAPRPDSRMVPIAKTLVGLLRLVDRCANPTLNRTPKPTTTATNERTLRGSGTTGIWLNNFSEFVSPKGKMFSRTLIDKRQHEPGLFRF